MQYFKSLPAYSPDDHALQKIITPEQHLWMNVIFRAYWDMTYYKESNHLIKDKVVRRQNLVHAKTAKNWILSKDHREQSFLWCADMCFTRKQADRVIRKLKKVAMSV